jgi:hypothetical protein
MHTSHTRAALFALAVLSSSAFAADIDMGAPMPRYGLLKEGAHHYLRFAKKGEAITPVDIWTREVRFTADAMEVRQRWDAPGSVKTLDSWFDKTTFKPRSHVRITEKDGKKLVEGFVFNGAKVTGMQDLADNAKKDLAVEGAEPTFNFETDIEMLQTMAWAPGYEARINFYHPGGPAPARYTWKVAGSETIAGPQGPVDCWLVTTDYNANSISKFWFAKATQLMVRQESTLPDGRLFVKTLID